MMLVTDSFRQFIGKHYSQPHFQRQRDKTDRFEALYNRGSYGYSHDLDHADAMMALMGQRDARLDSYQDNFTQVLSHHVEYVFNLIHDTNEIIEHFLNKKVT